MCPSAVQRSQCSTTNEQSPNLIPEHVRKDPCLSRNKSSNGQHSGNAASAAMPVVSRTRERDATTIVQEPRLPNSPLTHRRTLSQLTPHFSAVVSNRISKIQKMLPLQLFHRDRFRQVAGLIHIGALEHGHVIGEQL